MANTFSSIYNNNNPTAYNSKSFDYLTLQKCSCGHPIETRTSIDQRNRFPHLCNRCAENIIEMEGGRIVTKNEKHEAKVPKTFVCVHCKGTHVVHEVNETTRNPLVNWICDFCFNRIRNEDIYEDCENCGKRWKGTRLQYYITVQKYGGLMCQNCYVDYERLQDLVKQDNDARRFGMYKRHEEFEQENLKAELEKQREEVAKNMAIPKTNTVSAEENSLKEHVSRMMKRFSYKIDSDKWT